MSWLAVRSLRASGWAVLVVLAAAAAAGLVRLLPWLVAPEIPLEVALPFARALAAVATETAFLVGLPLGFAWAAMIAVERGESRALGALGVSPWGASVGQWRHAVAGAVTAAACSLAWGSSADAPGRFASQLVEQGRSSCARAEEPRSAAVPLVGVTWLCFPGRAPLVTGPLPGMGSRAWFTASGLVPSDDLREVALTDLRLRTQPDESRRWLDLQVRSGVVRGLPAWGRSPKLSVPRRAALVALTALVLAITACFIVLRAELGRRWQALGVGAVGPVVALTVLHRLDASSLGPGAYAWVPVAGLSSLAIVLLLSRRVAGATLR